MRATVEKEEGLLTEKEPRITAYQKEKLFIEAFHEQTHLG
jgi:hypothetical protein